VAYSIKLEEREAKGKVVEYKELNSCPARKLMKED